MRRSRRACRRFLQSNGFHWLFDDLYIYFIIALLASKGNFYLSRRLYKNLSLDTGILYDIIKYNVGISQTI